MNCLSAELTMYQPTELASQLRPTLIQLSLRLLPQNLFKISTRILRNTLHKPHTPRQLLILR